MKQLPQMKSTSYAIHVKLDEKQKIDYSNQNKKSKIIIPTYNQTEPSSIIKQMINNSFTLDLCHCLIEST